MRYIGTEAIARLAPSIFDHFKDRGLVEFHALPTEPPLLHISVQYLGAGIWPDDMAFLRRLATESGFTVEQGYTFGESLVIEVSMRSKEERPQTGVVLAFRRRDSAGLSPTIGGSAAQPPA